MCKTSTTLMKAELGNYILTGAGFSKNWGGWLSQELWNFLIGHAEVQQDEKLKELLWNNIDNGFEHALCEAKQRAENNDEWKKRYGNLQKVVSQAFKEMNALFDDVSNFCQGDYEIQKFIAEFDIIFTTNQDMLVEKRFSSLAENLCIPGIKSRYPGAFRGAAYLNDCSGIIDRDTQYPDSQGYNAPVDHAYIKLHGSSNWFTSQGGNELMILGGEKAAQIAGNTLIKSYFDILREKLSEPKSRLLILGHSLLDFHINEIIFEAIRNYGLKFYIWNNSGLKDLMKNLEKDPNYDEQFFKQGLIGVSIVSLQYILKEDSIREFEFARIKREFFGKA
ncbi:MAG: SIR2 family protein [Proteobacteria bacterium]|nr:SIR2 family protein [Pseudomonadota bacterium]